MAKPNTALGAKQMIISTMSHINGAHTLDQTVSVAQSLQQEITRAKKLANTARNMHLME
jgi:hypothetical protein